MRKPALRCPLFVLPILCLLGAIAAGTARAQCASPATSSFPPVMIVCPSGDIAYTAILRDAAGNPCVGQVLTMTLGAGCASSMCNVPQSQTRVSGNGGAVTFLPRAGGCCANVVSFVDPTGVVVGTAQFVASPDMDASCQVNLSDIAIFAAAFTGPFKRCADLSPDGIVNLSDIVVLAAHIGH